MALAIGGLAIGAIIAAIIEFLILVIIIILVAYIVYKLIEAIIDYVRTTTLEKTWDVAEPGTVTLPLPPNGLEKIDPKVLQKTKDLLKVIALTEALTRGPWNVYDVHIINNSIMFQNYAKERCARGSLITLPLFDIYRYGKTMKNSVWARYSTEYPDLTYSELRNRHVFACLKSGHMAGTEWYLYRYNDAVASALETALIQAYTALHPDNVRPAGNMSDH